jgi:CBS domain-containing protein
MQVFEAMTPEVTTVKPDTPLIEAARLMRENGIGPLPVCDGDRLLGILTDRDIAIRATAEGLDPQSTAVRQVMTSEVVTCFEGDDIRKAAEIMQRAQVRRLLVVDGDGRLAGIVSLGDIALQTGDDQLSGQTLERVSEPSTER